MAVPTPLTTTFTPPAACFTDIYLDPYPDAYAGKLGPGTQCIPDGPNPTLASYFSPGIYCPSGYTVACSSQLNIGSVTETRATCCPHAGVINGASAAAFSCQTQTDMAWYATYGCTMAYGTMVDSGDFTYTMTENGTTSFTTLSVGSTWGLNAYSVQLAWQASDLLTATTTSSSAGQTGGSSGSAGSGFGTSEPGVATVTGASSSSASGKAQDTNNSGLSTTAKIAIGVVVPVVVLLGLGIGAFLLMRRRKPTSKNRASQTNGHNDVSHGKAAINGGAGGDDGYNAYPGKHEMSAESTARPVFHELESDKHR